MGWFSRGAGKAKKAAAPVSDDSSDEDEKPRDKRASSKGSRTGSKTASADPAAVAVAEPERPAEVVDEALPGEDDDGMRDFDLDLRDHPDAYDSEEVDEEVGEPEEEEIDPQAEMQKLEANLRALYPQLQDMRTVIPEEELELAVRARRNPAIEMNAKFVFGTHVPVSMGAKKIPPVVGVTGHGGRRGNVGINGIYELYPDRFHGRPVYQKTLEKRWEDDLDANGPGRIRMEHRLPLMDQRQRLDFQRSQTTFIVKAPPKKPGRMSLWPAGESYFLFFDPGAGCWCIGPAVGHTEVFARCSAPDEPIPDRLEKWQVWDAGMHQWYEHRGLRTFKGCKGC